MKTLLLVFILFFSVALDAKDLELFAGGEYTHFTNIDEDVDYGGVSARFKYNHYQSNQGFFLHNQWRGYSVFVYDAIFGYGLRTSGAWFFEAGAGLAHATLWGLGYGIILSTGFDIGKSFYFSMPIVYRGGGASFISWSPMIGWRF